MGGDKKIAVKELNPFKMITDPMNPNTIITFLRKTNRIISQRVIDQPGVNKSNFIFKKVIGKS